MKISKKQHQSRWSAVFIWLIFLALAGMYNLNNARAQESVQPYTVIARPGVSMEEPSLNMPAKVRLYESKNGIRFETPQGYQISFALKNGDRVFFFRGDYFHTPEIVHRSPDSLAIQATPRGGTEVEIMISSTAYNRLDIGYRVHNNSGSRDTWHLYAFVYDGRGLQNVAYTDGEAGGSPRLTAQAELRVDRSGLPDSFNKDTASITFASHSPVYSWGSYPTVGPLNDDPTLHKTIVQDAPVLKGTVSSASSGASFEMMAHPKNSDRHVITSRGDSSIIRNDSVFVARLGHFDQSTRDNMDSLTVRAWGDGNTGTQTIEYQPGADTLFVNVELNEATGLAAPQQLSASTSSAYDQVILQWNEVEGAEEYIIYRDSTSSGRFDSLTTTANQSYFDMGLGKYAKWTYMVVPVDSSGQIGKPSYEVKKDVPPPPPQPPVSLFRDVGDDTLDNKIYEHANEALAFHYELILAAGETGTRNISVSIDSAAKNTQSGTGTIEWTGVSRDRISSATEADTKLAGYLLDVVDQNTVRDAEGNRYLTADRWARPDVYFWNYLALPAIASFDSSFAGNLFMNVIDRQRESGMVPSRLLDSAHPAPAEPLVAWTALATSRAAQDSSLFDASQWESIYNTATAHFNYWSSQFDSDSDSLLERHYYPVYAKLGTIPDIWADSTYLKGTESPDLHSFRIAEAKALADIAARIGRDAEASEWDELAGRLTEKLQSVFWDEESGYYFPVDADEGDFSFNESGDLKHRNLTGMLPLWADAVNANAAAYLKSDLGDTDRFNLKYGVPFVAADEPGYAQWDHAFTSGEWWSFLFEGVHKQGWSSRAETLSGKIEDQLLNVLADQHEFPYHYSAAWPSANKGKASIHTVIALDVLDKASRLKSTTDIGSANSDERPQKWTLGQNYPNPFNPVTVIPVNLNSKSDIKLEVYDRIGRKIQTVTEGTYRKGTHRFRFNAESLSSGMYIYKLSVDGSVKTGIMTLIK